MGELESGKPVDSLTSVSIRRAGRRDKASLLRLTPADIHRLTDWQHLNREGVFFTYLAEDRSPFGFVSAGEGEVMAIFLKKQYRGFGMGRKLLVRGLSVLNRRGFDSAHIWLAATSRVASNMILSLGFEADGSERYINKTDGDTLVETGYGISLAHYF